MIKREKTTGDTTVVTYICDNCVKPMPGAAINVYYPYGHINDSLDGPSHFCSDKCLVEFTAKLVKKYGPWRSKEEVRKGKRVRSSAEWRKGGVTNPKARRVVRRVRKIFRKRNTRKND
ncbi:hypothetical protein LCGC14_0944370 [marine sediment metagenome]|uniref:Uncharacterized protein n=1 Tax=marine sediment metagenome TaxID=412755 RepID=A0A0F9NJ50_9ZZZZ